MPTGSYAVGGRREDFSCAPGTLGWRYRSTLADLVCDDAFRLLRLTPADGPAVVAGRLAEGDPVLRWPAGLWPGPGCSGGPGGERLIAADAVVCDSVGSWVVLLRALAPVGTGRVEGTLQVRPQDAARVETWRVARAGGRLEQGVALVEEWVVTPPDRPERNLCLVGDVIVWASGLLGVDGVELTRLDGAPSWQP